MRPRATAAVITGKLAGAVSRRLGRGGGTALPGLLALRVDPQLIRALGQQLGRGSVVVTGTNGKTTTSRVLAQMASAAGVPILHNREGSNLARGIASALLAASTPFARVRGGDGLLGVFEVDEATLPAAARGLQPRAVAVTNLFRDQLDRYGEVDTVFVRWSEGLRATPRDATLVLNADDPSVAELALDWQGPVHWFGIEDTSLASLDPGAFDARWCRVCGGTFAYDVRFFAHAGHWRCSGCDRRRARPDTAATDIRLSAEDAAFAVPGLGTVTMPLTGAYNVANALAAIALGRVLGFPDAALLAGLRDVRPAFGRQEVAEVDGRRLHLLLSKNPAGANQVLRLLATIAKDRGALQVAVLLNDRDADGQDVSWTWDVDYELLAGQLARCWAGGDRAEDMALRLKYAGWPPPAAVRHGPADLLDAILGATAPGSDVFIAPTYTAMLDLRAELARRGAVSQFWEL